MKNPSFFRSETLRDLVTFLHWMISCFFRSNLADIFFKIVVSRHNHWAKATNVMYLFIMSLGIGILFGHGQFGVLRS